MIWILTMCTVSWTGLCAQYREIPYDDEKSCYRAMEELYKRQGQANFNYVLCVPRKDAKP
jgi:hypothetical protein